MSILTQYSIRVLLAKAGLDIHDRHLGVIARNFRDSGLEVIYLGDNQSADAVFRAALEENVDAVVLISSSGNSPSFFRTVSELMKRSGFEALVTGAANITENEKKILEAEGVGRIFERNARPEVLIEYVRTWYDQKKRLQEAQPARKSRLRK